MGFERECLPGLRPALGITVLRVSNIPREKKGVFHWEEGGLVVAGTRVIQHPEEAMSSLAEVTPSLPLKALARQEDKMGFRELELGKCVRELPGWGRNK